MSEININGTVVKGTNIVIINGKVIVDGKSVAAEGPKINITVQGNVDKIDVDYCEKVSVIGDVGEVVTSSGDIEINGSVKESIESSSGDIKVSGNVGGSVNTTSGDVRCKDVAGNVKTVSGDIN